jgi:hypothetical protein
LQRLLLTVQYSKSVVCLSNPCETRIYYPPPTGQLPTKSDGAPELGEHVQV